MRPVVVERIRIHRRALAARWYGRISTLTGTSPAWHEAGRFERHFLAGMDALVHDAPDDGTEAFAEFAGRLGQEALVLQVPTSEVVRALLQIKPVVVEFLWDEPPGDGPDAATVRSLDRMVSAGILEAMRRQERQRDRRTASLRAQVNGLRERLRDQTLVEPVTGLYNATYFAVAARREVLRSRRFERTFAIGMIALDLDEEMGESIGEEGLQAFEIRLADIMRRTARQEDVRAALGGGRFGIILPETTPEGAFAFADRLRRSVEQTTFAIPGHPFPLTQTVSIGLACYPRDGGDEQALLARAEEALARAASSRNTVVAAATAQEF
jgi:diguanylate cyclase (GGDEF)-like protein